CQPVRAGRGGGCRVAEVGCGGWRAGGRGDGAGGSRARPGAGEEGGRVLVVVADSPEFLESVANHPRVFPFVSVKGCGEIRFGPIWDDCVALQWEDGGFLFHKQDEGVYEVHTLFLPRAKDKHEKAEEALAHMWANGAR